MHAIAIQQALEEENFVFRVENGYSLENLRGSMLVDLCYVANGWGLICGKRFAIERKTAKVSPVERVTAAILNGFRGFMKREFKVSYVIMIVM